MKTLLIRSCLLAGAACAVSCSSVTGQKTPQENPKQKPAFAPASSEPAAPVSVSVPAGPVSLQPQPEQSSAPVVLPGDVRPGLRTPALPDTLLYDPAGKLIVPSAS